MKSKMRPFDPANRAFFTSRRKSLINAKLFAEEPVRNRKEVRPEGIASSFLDGGEKEPTQSEYFTVVLFD